MCQGIEYMAMPLDYGFSLLENFLQIEPLKAEVSPNSQSTTYSAWKSFLAIANIMIAIGFIVMIYSYLTGQGIQMYHIKKHCLAQ